MVTTRSATYAARGESSFSQAPTANTVTTAALTKTKRKYNKSKLQTSEANRAKKPKKESKYLKHEANEETLSEEKNSSVGGEQQTISEDMNTDEIEAGDSSVLEICHATNVPPEIFIHICKFLPPRDLLSLAQVCRLYNVYLCSIESQTTQDIWKNSRKRHIRFLGLPPPEGMDERAYVRLVLSRGCQFCKQSHSVRKVYWPFRVRCCRSCKEERTVPDWLVESEYNISKVIVEALPYIQSQKWARRRGTFWVQEYWREQVIAAKTEYEAFGEDKQARICWLQRKKNECEMIMRDVYQREQEEQEERRIRSVEIRQGQIERINAVDKKISEMVNDEKDQNDQPKYNLGILRQCSSLKNAYNAKSPLTSRAWTILRKKLEVEYAELVLGASMIASTSHAAVGTSSNSAGASSATAMDLISIIGDFGRRETQT